MLFEARASKWEDRYNYFLKLPKPLKLLAIKYFCKMGLKSLKKINSPSRLIFYITNKCNLQCGHCFYGKEINKNSDKELTLPEIKQIILSLRQRLRSLTLTGGEPILREDLADICSAFSELNRTQTVTIPTNGFYPVLTESTLKDILGSINMNVNVQVSIDGLEETHDEIRGKKDAFKRAIETVERCKKLQKKFFNLSLLSILTTVSNKNYNELKQLANFVGNNLGVFHKFRLIRDSHSNVYCIDPDILSDFKPYNNNYLLPEFSKLEDLRDFLNEAAGVRASLLSKLQLLYMEYSLNIIKKKKRILHCLAGKVDGVIYPSGDIGICEMTVPFGNLRDNSLDLFKMWNSEAANRMRARMMDCFCVHPCNMLTSMSYDEDTLVSLCISKSRDL